MTPGADRRDHERRDRGARRHARLRAGPARRGERLSARLGPAAGGPRRRGGADGLRLHGRGLSVGHFAHLRLRRGQCRAAPGLGPDARGPADRHRGGADRPAGRQRRRCGARPIRTLGLRPRLPPARPLAPHRPRHRPRRPRAGQPRPWRDDPARRRHVLLERARPLSARQVRHPARGLLPHDRGGPRWFSTPPPSLDDPFG